jgi:PiT family inorganic phosphate transporter
MSEAVADHVPLRPNLDARPPFSGLIIFALLLAVGVGYTLNGLISDIDTANTPPVAVGAFVLLGIALLIALGFEFVNGFHDTANAVATVIYTHSLPAPFAVVWSGAFNFLGVMASSGAVAFGILTLLPVELILQVGGSAGFAMIFALLIAAIIWNLGTWWLGLPASSSHTLIGSIIGAGIANQLMAPAGSGTSGVDWTQAMGGVPRAVVQPGDWLRGGSPVAAVRQSDGQKPDVVRGPNVQRPAADLDPRPADPDLHGRLVRARL